MKFMMLQLRIQRNLVELLAHEEEYIVESGTVGTTCDWGTMVVPVVKSDDDL